MKESTYDLKLTFVGKLTEFYSVRFRNFRKKANFVSCQRNVHECKELENK